MSMCMTLASAAMCSKEKRSRISFYIGSVIFYYIMFCALHQCYAKENQFVIHNESGVEFLYDNTYFSEKIQKAHVPSRPELIKLMADHKRAHDNGIGKAEDVLRHNNLFTVQAEDLFNAAKASVTTYACGGRNFLYPAIAAILEYSFSQGYQAYKIWNEYECVMHEVAYNAEMFDFYMRVLKQVYGQ